MKRFIFARLQWLKALTIYRAIFHEVVSKGEVCPFSKQLNDNKTIHIS